jgi:beta-phosphoglucomutase-like phosphatase (HAD superfamily)
MPLEALIFDVDGTLAETEELHRQAFNETFRAFGLDWVWERDLYRELLRVTGGRERIAHFVDLHAPAGAAGALARVREMHAEKTARYAALARTGDAPPRPGVRRLIEEAHAAGVPLAIATTTSPGNVEPLLGAMIGPDALSWFSVIAAGDIVPAKKPAPDIYDYVLRALGCAASNCVAFEDSQNGVRAARQAGLAVVATPSFYSSADDFGESASVLSDLGEAGEPARHIAGWRFGKGFVDLAGLRSLLDAAAIASPPHPPVRGSLAASAAEAAD